MSFPGAGPVRIFLQSNPCSVASSIFGNVEVLIINPPPPDFSEFFCGGHNVTSEVDFWGISLEVRVNL